MNRKDWTVVPVTLGEDGEIVKVLANDDGTTVPLAFFDHHIGLDVLRARIGDPFA
jgi:hypothetical protein